MSSEGLLQNASVSVRGDGAGSFALVSLESAAFRSLNVTAQRAAVHLRNVSVGEVTTRIGTGFLELTAPSATAVTGRAVASDIVVSARATRLERTPIPDDVVAMAADSVSGLPALAAANLTCSDSGGGVANKSKSATTTVDCVVFSGPVTVFVHPHVTANTTAPSSADAADLRATTVPVPMSMARLAADLVVVDGSSAASVASSTSPQGTVPTIAVQRSHAALAGLAGHFPETMTAGFKSMIDLGVTLPRAAVFQPGGDVHGVVSASLPLYGLIPPNEISVLSLGLLAPSTGLVYVMPTRAYCGTALSPARNVRCSRAAAPAFVTDAQSAGPLATNTSVVVTAASTWTCLVTLSLSDAASSGSAGAGGFQRPGDPQYYGVIVRALRKHLPRDTRRRFFVVNALNHGKLFNLNWEERLPLEAIVSGLFFFFFFARLKKK
jgi:hypothetical protein